MGGGGGGEGGTVIEDVPDLPPAEARMVVDPAATPVTNPPEETVATAVFDDVHVNVVADPGGLAVAVSCAVAPAATVALDGATATDLTDLGCPPLANDGDSVLVADGADVSEHAANASAIPAAATAAEPTRTDPVRIGVCLSLCRWTLKRQSVAVPAVPDASPPANGVGGTLWFVGDGVQGM